MSAQASSQRMRSIFFLVIIVGVLATVIVLAGWGSAAATEKPAAAAGKARAELNVGYSLLYQQASGIPKMNWILRFKDKRENIDQATQTLLDYYKQLSQSLESVSMQYPAVRLDATTMPELLADTRKSIGLDIAKDFAPVIGDTGPRFERELLLMFYNALDEQRHLVRVMIEKESEPGLQSFLEKTRTQLEARRKTVEDLLDRQYFRPAAK